MPSTCSAGPDLVRATFQGHRPCAARPGWAELILRVDGHRLSWCVPLGADDDVSPPGAALTFRWRGAPSARLAIEETDRAGRTAEVSAARVLTLMSSSAPPGIHVDERLLPLHA
jgi:hypothetical protein